MGGILDVLPDALNGWFPVSGWAAVGGTYVTAVNDASDASYITDNTTGSYPTQIRWTLANTSLPAGAAIKYAYPRFRHSQAAGNGKLQGYLASSSGTLTYQSPVRYFTPTAVIQDNNLTTAGSVPQSKSQAILNNMTLTLTQYQNTKIVEDHRIYRAMVRFEYVDSPTVSAPALNPSNANTLSTRPALSWAYDSVDGLPQYEYRVALWKLSDITTFSGGRAAFESGATNMWLSQFTGTDAAVHKPIWTSGGWVVSTTNTVTPDKDLDGTSQYVYYVQVSALWSGERLAHPTNIGILDFTQAITIPSQPTSTTAVWQRDFQYQTQVSVAVPAQTLGSWTGRRVIVERRIVGGSADSWITLPLGTKEAGASAGTLIFYDTLAGVNRNLEYRAKTLLYKDPEGYTSTSAWVTSGSITASFNAFVLRNPFREGSAVVFRILGDLEATQAEEQGEFRPLASKYPVIISDKVLAKRWRGEVRVKDAITELFIDLLRDDQAPLVFQTDMTDRWYWVRMGPEQSKRLLRQVDRVDQNKREQVWTFDLIEILAPTGQPQVYI